MGLLDSKTRIFDTIVTLEGRRQIAAGKMKAEFYSFTDAGSFYAQDTSVSAAFDGTKRVYLEANSLPQDMVTFEADDAGKLVQFPNTNMIVRNGQILLQVTSSASGSTGRTYLPTEDNIFASMADSLLSSSIDSYRNQYIIGSPDIFDESQDEFLVSPNEIEFTVSDTAPLARKNEIYQGNIETTDGLFLDSRLSHLPNFQYLAPINKYRPGDASVNMLGNYPILNQRPQLTYGDVEKEFNWAVKRGYSTTISFEETSQINNLVCQMFEVGKGEVVKLDVIDFGLFTLSGEDISVSDRKRQESDPRNRPILTKHVFFVGKVFTDSKGVHKFINLFTLIFE